MSNIAIKGATTGTGTFTIESPATNTDRTLTLPDEAGTVLTSASSIPAANITGNIIQNSGPAFYAYAGGSGVVGFSLSTDTKLVLNQTLFDTDSCWDATNYRFIPTTAGYYWFYCSVQSNWTGNQFTTWETAIWKNGVSAGSGGQGVARSRRSVSTYDYGTNSTAGLVYMNGTTDYVEGYVWANGGSNPCYDVGSFYESYLTGYMVRSA